MDSIIIYFISSSNSIQLEKIMFEIISFLKNRRPEDKNKFNLLRNVNQ